MLSSATKFILICLIRFNVKCFCDARPTVFLYVYCIGSFISEADPLNKRTHTTSGCFLNNFTKFVIDIIVTFFVNLIYIYLALTARESTLDS